MPSTALLSSPGSKPHCFPLSRASRTVELRYHSIAHINHLLSHLPADVAVADVLVPVEPAAEPAL
jgi:hypothetical protein